MIVKKADELRELTRKILAAAGADRRGAGEVAASLGIHDA